MSTDKLSSAVHRAAAEEGLRRDAHRIRTICSVHAISNRPLSHLWVRRQRGPHPELGPRVHGHQVKNFWVNKNRLCQLGPRTAGPLDRILPSDRAEHRSLLSHRNSLEVS